MDHIADIKARLSIEDVTAKYVQLQKAGANFKALCPFHQEKTPSFIVSPGKQLAYCFGCRRGGDIFKFMQEVEGIDFVEALKLLADQAGVKLPERIVTEKKGKRDLLKALHRDASLYYEAQLWDTKEGEKVLSYLVKKRKFSKDTVKRFSLGFSPEKANELIVTLIKKGYSQDEILESGTGSPSKFEKGALRDRFFGRLIIPIFDAYGDVVAFGGRAMKDEAEPKYLNSKETALYEKGNMLYGFHAAKEAIRENDSVLIVEGYMDVLRAHEAGIKNTVGTCGTALTGNQVRLLKRFTKNLVFFFDGDDAGKNATLRAFEPAVMEDMFIKVLRPEKEKDPDDWIRDEEKDAKDAIEDPPLFFDFLFDEMKASYDLAKIDQQKKALSFLFPFLAKMKSKVEQDRYFQQLAEILKVSPKTVYSDFTRFKSAPSFVKETFETRVSTFSTAEYLLGCFLQFPETFDWAKERLSEADFEGEQNRLYRNIESIYNTARKPEEDVFSLVAEELREKARLLALFSEAQNGELPYNEVLEEVKHATAKLLRENQEKLKKQFLARIREAESERDTRMLAKLLSEYQLLLKS